MFSNLLTILSQPYFSWIAQLLKVYPQAEVFLVGGAVRDAILGRATKDYDFVVRGIQARHLQYFLASIGIVNLVGRVFGVYKFIPDDGYEEFKSAGLESFDIALPRSEQSWGTGGARDVEVQSDHELPIEKDLGRRDFTINAIALRLDESGIMNQELGIVDPHKGMEDIKAKIIRAVGDPKARFQEDYTRILRALRFACELKFTIDKNTMEALQNIIPAINDTRRELTKLSFVRAQSLALSEFVAPREVVASEFLRAFYADPVRAFDLYDESGAFSALIPELLKMKQCPQPDEFHSEGDVWTHTRMALEALSTQDYKNTFGDPDPRYNSLLIMSILLHDIGKPLMIKTPEEHGVERIRFDEHSDVGAALAREIARRLILSIMPINGIYHVDTDKLGWLIKHHLILLNSDPEDLKAATVEKYFFNLKNPGEELLRLTFCDGSASAPKNGKADLSRVYGMMARIKRMEKAVREKQIFVKPLINGNEIMKILSIPPGPGVGEIIRDLREEQLSARVTNKDGAIAFIKERFELPPLRDGAPSLSGGSGA